MNFIKEHLKVFIIAFVAIILIAGGTVAIIFFTKGNSEKPVDPTPTTTKPTEPSKSAPISTIKKEVFNVEFKEDDEKVEFSFTTNFTDAIYLVYKKNNNVKREKINVVKDETFTYNFPKTNALYEITDLSLSLDNDLYYYKEEKIEIAALEIEAVYSLGFEDNVDDLKFYLLVNNVKAENYSCRVYDNEQELENIFSSGVVTINKNDLPLNNLFEFVFKIEGESDQTFVKEYSVPQEYYRLQASLIAEKHAYLFGENKISFLFKESHVNDLTFISLIDKDNNEIALEEENGKLYLRLKDETWVEETIEKEFTQIKTNVGLFDCSLTATYEKIEPKVTADVTLSSSTIFEGDILNLNVTVTNNNQIMVEKLTYDEEELAIYSSEIDISEEKALPITGGEMTFEVKSLFINNGEWAKEIKIDKKLECKVVPKKKIVSENIQYVSDLEHPYIILEFDSELDDVQAIEYSFISGMDENGFVSQTQNTCPYIIEGKFLKIDADKIKIYGLGTYHLFFSNLSISYGGLNQNVEVFDDYTFVVTNEVTAFANFKTAENNSVTFECITTIEDLRLVSMNLKLYDSDGNALLGGKDKAYSLEYKGQHKIGNGLYSQIYSISYLPDLTKSLKFVSVTADSEKVKEEDPENYFGIYINNVSSENQVNGRYEIETED